MNKLAVLDVKNIYINQKSISKKEAIIAAGNILVQSGYVKDSYIESMLRRDKKLSVYLGSYLAIPHGEFEGKDDINYSGISVFIYPDGIDWDGDEVKVVIGLAGIDNDHMDILSNLAIIFSEEENIEEILNADDPQTIYDLLSN
ncbi:MAG: PTS sugar transporter subunit IIA [Erysipelotrichaceae bacterium]|nr:PTS sugar transporter subunit IIA [Erysipelotrichaceae bacterium]